MTSRVAGSHIIRRADLRPEPWKNGGGITREIWSETFEGDLLWRLSMADVATDGPFSIFPNMTRVLTVIQGAGLDLHGAGQVLAAPPETPLRFDGDTPLDSVLRAGEIVDFNLIHHSQYIHSDVAVIHGPCPIQPNTSGDLHVLHCISGKVTLGASQTLGPGDTALIPNKDWTADTQTSDACIVVTLTDQIDASSPFIASR